MRYNSEVITEFLDSWVYIGYVFLFGLIFGSFLNVYLYRFHTGRSLNGSSHCLSCNVRLEWYDLVPILSYVFLRGRCRRCRSYIPPRYFLVEFTVAMMFVLAAFSSPIFWIQVLTAVFLTILTAVLVYDLYHTIIPDEFSIALTVLALIKLGYEFSLLGEWEVVWRGLLAGGAAAGPFLFLWVISQGRWIGLGDAKLAFPLGLWVGLGGVVSMVIWSFWIGAGVSLVLMLVQQLLKRGKMDLRLFGRPLTMKSEIPFAPFMVVAFVLVNFFALEAISLIQYGLY